jgi:glycosyltransferase involved in cell wall biosynthesis
MDDRPTICQVLHSLKVGGAEMLAVALARGLRDRYRFIFVCLDELGRLGAELHGEGFEVATLGRRPGIDPLCAWRLGRIWRRQQVRLVHAHQYTPFFYAMSARMWRRRPPVIFTEHGRWYPDYPRRRRILFNRLTLRRTDRVVGVGEAVRQALIRNEGFPDKRVEVIYNGVDVSAFDADQPDRASVRREWGLGPDDLVIAQVARLDHLKDHATAIRTIDRVARRRGNARLLLVGDGPQQEVIEAEIRAHNVQDHVRLLGLRDDIPRLLHAADLFLLTSISEGIPVTLIEAMAARLPIVSTKVGGVAEIVQAGRTGLLTAPGDDAALAEAVLRLADDPALGRAMGELGHERARTVFSQKGMHDAYQARFEEMLDA